MEVPQKNTKTKRELVCDSVVPLLSVHMKASKSSFHRNTCTSVSCSGAHNSQARDQPRDKDRKLTQNSFIQL